MTYFEGPNGAWGTYLRWLELRQEQGGDVAPELGRAMSFLRNATRRAERMGVPQATASREPDDLAAIRRLRPRGPRRIDPTLTDAQLEDRLLGAWLGRSAGCILGIPPEGFSKDEIRNACRSVGMRYPLNDYWTADPKPARGPDRLQYGITPRRKFLRDGLSFVGADDDLAYTLLGLLILEEYGPDFTPQHVGEAWLKYLPLACTAEKVALENLRAGLKPPETALEDNPFSDWIGADIRSDPWGYAAPGWLEKAAEFAHRDAVVSHRATGIHGEMFFSAAIAAAFVVDDPVEALRLGLTEMPRECRTAKAVRSALRRCARDGDWEKTVDAMLKKYIGMSKAHTLNNAELTVAAIHYGDGDFGKTIRLAVMAGEDTDCTAATAGSIVGAVLGRKRLPKKWIAPLGDRVQTYLNGKQNWRSSNIARRFRRVAKRVLEQG